MKQVLLVDDDASYLGALQRTLERRSYQVRVAQTAAEALAAINAWTPDAILLDLRLARESGLDLIAPLREACPAAHLVLVTGYASVATAVEAIKRGADDYLPKPVSLASVLRALEGKPAVELAEELPMTPLSRVEWEHIQQALQETDGNVSAAARLLGMHRRSLQRKLGKRPGSEGGEPPVG